jgi:hypothetical protein
LAGLLRVVDEADGAVRAALSLNARTSVLLLCTEGATDPEAYRRVSTGAK